MGVDHGDLISQGTCSGTHQLQCDQMWWTCSGTHQPQLLAGLLSSCCLQVCSHLWLLLAYCRFWLLMLLKLLVFISGWGDGHVKWSPPEIRPKAICRSKHAALADTLAALWKENDPAAFTLRDWGEVEEVDKLAELGSWAFLRRRRQLSDADSQRSRECEIVGGVGTELAREIGGTHRHRSPINHHVSFNQTLVNTITS